MKKINNKNCQECDIVILSTDNSSVLMLDKNELKYSKQYGFELFDEKNNFRHINKKNIYILSSDGIKNGDWYMVTDFSKVEDLKQANQDFSSEEQRHNGYKKVIATTDVSLLINVNCENYKREHCGGYCCGVKKINEKFIKYYIKEFNKGNILNKAFVECKYKINKSAGHFHQYREYYFFANGNNEINILTEQVKKMYSEEEIMDIQKEWSLFSDSQDSFNGQDDLTFNEWFQKFKKK
jgi:hypothetical protein